jgi:hypothetical protein
MYALSHCSLTQVIRTTQEYLMASVCGEMTMQISLAVTQDASCLNPTGTLLRLAETIYTFRQTSQTTAYVLLSDRPRQLPPASQLRLHIISS